MNNNLNGGCCRTLRARQQSPRIPSAGRKALRASQPADLAGITIGQVSLPNRLRLIRGDYSTVENPSGAERILFIDDEKALIDVGRRMLERLGYSDSTN